MAFAPYKDLCVIATRKNFLIYMKYMKLPYKKEYP